MSKPNQVLSPHVITHVKNTVDEAVAKALSAAMASPVVKDIEGIGAAPPDEPVDTEQVFQLFAIYCGDTKRTALASGLSEERINEDAEKYGWKEKLKVLIDLRTSGRPGDSERGINRAINFVQAHRLRNVIQSVITKLSALSARDLDALLLSTEIDKNGNVYRKIVTRPFADLASAMEKCHASTYAALNDTVGERKERQDEPTDQRSTAELHLQLTKAMAEARTPAK